MPDLELKAENERLRKELALAERWATIFQGELKSSLFYWYRDVPRADGAKRSYETAADHAEAAVVLIVRTWEAKFAAETEGADAEKEEWHADTQ